MTKDVCFPAAILGKVGLAAQLFAYLDTIKHTTLHAHRCSTYSYIGQKNVKKTQQLHDHFTLEIEH